MKIVVRISAILLAVLLTHVLYGQTAIELSHILDGTFSEETVNNVNWMEDGQFYTALENNSIVKYDITTGALDTVLFDASAYSLNLDDYQFSKDEQQLVLMTERKSVYRRSYTAKFFVYNFENETLEPLSEKGRESYATFSPDGSKIAFTRDNNLFFVRLDNMNEVQVTADGEKNKIINGSTDWVYEEEFSITKAFFWSPDSKRLAYYRFDESDVKEYTMQLWNNVSLYPENYKFKYPKAGEKNSTVEIKIHTLETNETTTIDLGKETDIYIPRVQWTNDPTLLSVQKLNRMQNTLDIMHANATRGNTINILTERSRQYIDMNFCDELIYLDNGKHFLIASERDGFKHFYLHTMDGQTVQQVTIGKWEAREMVGLDQSSRTPVLYYISTENSPKDRSFYKIDVRGRGKTLLSPLAGWTDIDMSNDFKYYIQYYRGADQPAEITLMDNEEEEVIKVLKDNQTLKDKVEQFGLAKKQFFTFDGADKSILNGYMLLPASLDSTSQYPVLLFQYSGPGSQNVTHRWGGSHYIWHQYLVQQGYIVVVVDTRGTGARGEAFKKMTYKELGKLETEDLIAAAQYLAGVPFVDSERLGIWGWSYGGYMSSLAMLKGADYFKTAIAVAPVTTWRFYDTVYTERYLQRPQDNPSGYDENSPLNHVEKLKGNYLLIHGTGDDNVHFQNSVAMQEALINAGKQFQSFYYPDKAHGIRGKEARMHLYRMMTDFLLEKL